LTNPNTRNPTVGNVQLTKNDRMPPVRLFYDDFKKLFSGPKIAKNLLVQFCRDYQEKPIALKIFKN